MFVFSETWPFILMLHYESFFFALQVVSVNVGIDMKTGGSDWESRGRSAARSYVTLKFFGYFE